MTYIIKIKIALVITLSLLLFGCNDWLRIDPDDAILDEQVFETELTTQVALNGIYIKMGKENQYGKHLTNWTIELLAQQYAVSETSKDDDVLKYNMNSYNYSEEKTSKQILDIWSGSYNTILDINYFIKKLEATKGVIVDASKNIMLGEAYGLRAFMHFDVLRLFGPVYAVDSTKLSIPYYSEPKAALNEREAANVIMDKILSDINVSMEYLKDDPIRVEGPMAVDFDSLSVSQMQIDQFYRFRNRRMNYYAATALKSRVLMYRKNTTAAAETALSLVEDAAFNEHFPWVKLADINKPNLEDRIQSTEVLFGIHSPKMYSIWDQNFSPGVTLSYFMGPTQLNVKYMFDIPTSTTIIDLSQNTTDYRARNWKNYSDPAYMSTYKFFKSSKENYKWYFQPLIRKSELYYIIAEAKNDKEYIDQVRINRALKKLSDAKPTSPIATELLLEYMREFQGEGQLFYFYKRRNTATIRNGSSTSSSANVSMNASKYVLPIPQKELDK